MIVTSYGTYEYGSAFRFDSFAWSRLHTFADVRVCVYSAYVCSFWNGRRTETTFRITYTASPAHVQDYSTQGKTSISLVKRPRRLFLVVVGLVIFTVIFATILVFLVSFSGGAAKAELRLCRSLFVLQKLLKVQERLRWRC